jgi:hypothetical protein
MQRFRSTWLALVGGALLITLSVSAAFGADPVDSEGNRGQTVAAFVHELIFGADDQPDDEVNEDEDTDTDTEEDETDEDPSEVIDSGGEITDPDTTEDDETEDTEEVEESEDTEDSTREVPEEFANHGECVSAAAHDEEGFEESRAANHGEWVSQNARYTCWGLEVPGEDAEDEAIEDTDESTVDETDTDTTDTDELSAKEQRKADKAAARAERKAERASAKAARTHGGGNGKGHGH